MLLKLQNEFCSVRFEKKTRFGLDTVAIYYLIFGGFRGTKNRIVFVKFQSECYVKI